MSHSQLISLMQALRITLGPSLTQHILAFHQSLPQMAVPKPMGLIAAAAVRAEAQLVESVGGIERVKYGLTVEQFLRHVDSEEKQVFLEAVEAVLAAWREAPSSLVSKFNQLKRTYRLFLNYRSIFAEVCSSLELSSQLTSNLTAAFWMVYLKARPLPPNPLEEQQQLRLLLGVMEFAAQRLGGHLAELQIGCAFLRQFGSLPQITQNQRKMYDDQFKSILKQAYHIRYNGQDEMDLCRMGRDEIFMQRFVDDFSAKMEQDLEGQELNELTYLELDHSLTPQTIIKKAPTQPTIETTINFSSDEPEQMPHCQQQQQQQQQNKSPRRQEGSPKAANLSPTLRAPGESPHSNLSRYSPPQEESSELFRHFQTKEIQNFGQVQRRRKKFVINRCQTRISILKWVQDQVAGELGTQIEDLKELEAVREYEEVSENVVMSVVEEVSTNCRDKPKRCAQIFRLFLSFLLKMRKVIPHEEFLGIICTPKYMDALLCLTCLIFNYAYKADHLSFREYCQRFDISILSGFVPLNWVGVHAQLPRELQIFLFELEQRILFQYLLKEIGCQLFNAKSLLTFAEMAAKKRMTKHLHHRIGELTKNDLSDKEKIAIFKLVEEVILGKSVLLNTANLYVNLACTLVHIHPKAFSLQKVIEALKKSDSIVRITLQACDQMGHPLSIEEYYRSIFSREMDIVRKDITITPIKMTPSTATRGPSQHCQPMVKFTCLFGVDLLSKSNRDVGEYRKKYIWDDVAWPIRS